MKRVIKRTIEVFGRVWHVFFQYGCLNRVKALLLLFYNSWISGEFKSIGKGCSFRKEFVLLGGRRIEIGNNVRFGKSCILTAWEESRGVKYNPHIFIGDDCNFGEFNHITAINFISIGNGFLSGRWVTISDNSHGRTDYDELKIPPLERTLHSKGAVIIGKDVWVGDKVTILPGVIIGDGVVVAANTVVTKDIPAYCVVAGNPGRIVKVCQ